MLLPDFDLPARPYESNLTKLQQFWFQPSFYGTEYLSDTPAMFVGNQTIYGALDVPLLRTKLYNDHDIFLRLLVDRVRYEIPYWKEAVEERGGFLGTRELCSQAMEQGDNLLLFPGGGREVMKRDGEAYQLMWKERLGFVKMAAEHDYLIQPFASIGAEEAYSILLDADDMQKLPFLKVIKNTRLWKKFLKHGDEIPPLSRGVALSPVPRPEPFFFIFGEAIETSAYRKKIHDDEAMAELRDTVQEAVEGLIEEGKNIRQSAPKQALWRRFLKQM